VAIRSIVQVATGLGSRMLRLLDVEEPLDLAACLDLASSSGERSVRQTAVALVGQPWTPPDGKQTASATRSGT